MRTRVAILDCTMPENGHLKQAIIDGAYERYDAQEATDFDRLMILFHEEHVETRECIIEEGRHTRRAIHEESRATRDHIDAQEGSGTNRTEKAGIFGGIGAAIAALVVGLRANGGA